MLERQPLEGPLLSPRLMGSGYPHRPWCAIFPRRGAVLKRAVRCESRSRFRVFLSSLMSAMKNVYLRPNQYSTACGHRMAHRKWREIKLQPGTAGSGNRLGSCSVSFHILLANLCLQGVCSTYKYPE